jgi:5'-nucleotidase
LSDGSPPVHTKSTFGWYPDGVRIMVTNDDGIDSLGLHHLARAMNEFGDVVIVAPDREYSGASCAVGALWDYEPVVHRREIDGVPESWTLNGPPALCAMYARLGVFGHPFDLVVSGINPGANVGRSVYHSGTVGACLSARNGGTSGIAVSQATTGWGVEGQASWDEIVQGQRWEVAAEVARTFVEGYLADPPGNPVVVNLNVPNVDLDGIKGWRMAEVGLEPPRSMSSAKLVPTDEDGRFGVDLTWGDPAELPAHTDGGAIERDHVTVSYISRLENEARYDLAKAEASLDALLGDD